jgi:DNA topoisomerase I
MVLPMPTRSLHPRIREPRGAAVAAGLAYVSEEGAGIRRQRAGTGWRYIGPDGQTVRDRAVASRIRALAIPPAWRDVWISPSERGHIQATGRDAKGRKQYRYHARFREVRDAAKFDRMLAFARTLPRVRWRVARDLGAPGLPSEKVLAALVRMLETTLIRVGNEEYARKNRSYGLTTMRNEHVYVEGPVVHFGFRGKSGKDHVVTVRDRRLAGIVQQCHALPGRALFQFLDRKGRRRGVDSDDVNRYLRQITGRDFSAKDFRTWAATVLAAVALEKQGPAPTATRARKNVMAAVEAVAERLGNTATIARKSYVHPAVLEAYLDGSLGAGMAAEPDGDIASLRLRREERAVLALLRARLAAAAAKLRRSA